MVQLSIEQQTIIDEQKNKVNMVVDSVAGSGKSTISLYLAKNYPERKYLLLTYNAKLKLETRQRIKDMGLENIICHSFHSFAVNYIDNSAYTDSRLFDVIDDKFKTRPEFDTLIIDEIQDMNDIYYKLVKRIYKQNKTKKANIIVVGDQRQSIYQFNGANDKYIKNSKEHFDWNQFKWVSRKLSTSFRITHQIASLVNACVKTPFINAVKNGTKTKYLIKDSFKVKNDLIPIIEKYEPGEIFVLAASVKSPKAPVSQLANALSMQGYPLYLPSDNETINEEVAKGKIVFSSFHQAKGLERPLVIVMGFGDSYFRFYGRNLPKNKLPNTIYVAMTRASEQLVVVQDKKESALNFINKEEIENICFVLGFKSEPEKFTDRVRTKGVCDMIKHIPMTVQKNLMSRINITTIREASTSILIPKVYKGEFVANISGEAIPIHFMLNILKKDFQAYDNRIKSAFENLVKDRQVFDNIDITKPQDLLRYATLLSAFKSRVVFKINQLPDYKWLNKSTLDKCMQNMVKLGITKNDARFEVYVCTTEPKINISGYIDCVEGLNVWEFKCVNELDDSHVLQLVLYKYLLENGNSSYWEDEDERDGIYDNYYLYNVLTDELLKIEISEGDCKYVYKTLVNRAIHSS